MPPRLPVQRVLGITAEAEIGKIYVGKVERIVDFGAFVNILPGKDGLVHISHARAISASRRSPTY